MCVCVCVSILTVREFNVLPGDAVRVLLLESPTASVARLGCTTFQYNNPNDNTDEYPSGYSNYISADAAVVREDLLNR